MNNTPIFPLLAWSNDPMEAAAIVGHTTESTARLWLRTGYKGGFILFVYLYNETLEDYYGGNIDELSEVLQSTDTPEQMEATLHVVCQNEIEINDFCTDTTHVEHLEGLAPNTSYGYLLYDVNRTTTLLGAERPRQFRTAPEGRRMDTSCMTLIELLHCLAPNGRDSSVLHRRNLTGVGSVSQCFPATTPIAINGLVKNQRLST